MPMTVVHMNDQQALRDATVQDIQLELIRRRRFNQFDGPRVYDFLMKHRHLWQAVIMDRLGYVSAKNDSGANWGLIKLRDMPANHWNVDTLIVMTDSVATANRLAQLFDEADLGGEKAVVEGSEATSAALGVYPCERGLVSVWWD
jgi:hypothetical protein